MSMQLHGSMHVCMFNTLHVHGVSPTYAQQSKQARNGKKPVRMLTAICDNTGLRNEGKRTDMIECRGC
jgi:hypothetical protein